MSSTKNPEHHHHHNVVYKKPNHRYNLNQRDDSDDEIDVFEATKYFAAGACSHIHQKSMLNYKNNNITDDQPVGGRRSRISLDTSSPFRSNQSFSSSQSHQKQTKHQKPKSKYKQEPVSPGGKLVSFLNSLFNQTSSSSSKKKKSKDEDQRSHHDLSYAAGRRKRRSSISHFPSFNNKISTAAVSVSDMKSSPPLFSPSLTSGFRTPPPPYSTKAAKMYQNSSSDPVITTSKQQLNNLSMHSGRGSSISLQDQKMINRDMETIDVLYEKYKKINSLSEKKQSKDKDGMIMRITRTLIDNERHLIDVDDDGGESDSSSDLFELQNYDLCSEYCSVSGERDGVDYRR